MIGTTRLFFLICLIFSGAFVFSSCNNALHNEGRTAFPDEQAEIKDTSVDMEVWQTDHLAIQYRIKDMGSSFTITGTVHIKDRITLSFPVTDFLNIYVNLLDRDGVATSKHNIGAVTSRFNTVPSQIRFTKTVQKDEDTALMAFSYWGKFRERGVGNAREVVDWEIFYNPFEKRDSKTQSQ
jgi:hypothetical protein